MPDRNFDYLFETARMFSHTGLGEEQVERLRGEFGVYLIAEWPHIVSPGLMIQMYTAWRGICRCHVIFRPDGDNSIRPDNSCCDHPLS